LLPWFKWCVARFVGGVASGVLTVAGAEQAGLATGLLLVLQSVCSSGLPCADIARVGTWIIFASMIGWMLFILGGAWGWIVSGQAVGLLQYLSLTNWKGAAW
jgi:hypothetical protein